MTEIISEALRRFVDTGSLTGASGQYNYPHSTDFTEVRIGRTPAGGAYSVAYFYNADFVPCKKRNAVHVSVVEFSGEGDYLDETFAVSGQETIG